MANASKSIRERMLKVSKSVNANTKTNINKVKSNSGNYMANVAKSLFFSGSDAVTKTLLPNLYDTYDMNKELIGEISQSLKNPSSLGSKFKIIDDDIAKELRELRDNALDDLKTGKFYNPKRDRSNFGKETQSLLDEFAGYDLEGFGDEGGSETSEIVQSQEDIYEKQEDNADDRTRVQIRAIGESTSAIVESQENIARTDIRSRMTQHAQTMGGIGNLISTNTAMYELQVNTFNSMTQNIAAMSDSIVGKLDEILNELKSANSGTDENGQGKRVNRYVGRNDNFDLPINQRGLLDIKKYGKHIMKQTDNTFQISNAIQILTGGMSPKDLIDLYKSNPLQFVTDRAVSAIIPEMTKKLGENLNKSIGGFFSSLMLKMNNMKDAKGMAQYLGKMFGMPMYSNTEVNLSDYNKGEIKFNGKVEKAIIEVIPSLLRVIAQGVTGKSIGVYDYEKGKVINPYEAIKEHNSQMNDLTRHMSGTTSYFDKRINSMNFTSEGRDIFRNDLKNYLQATAAKGIYINPKNTANKLGISMESTQSEALIRAMIERMPKNVVHNVNREIVRSHYERNESSNRANKEIQDSGLGSLYNGFDKSFGKYASELKYGTRITERGYEELTNKAKGQSKTHDYLKKILGILKRGIVTFSGGSGTGEGSSYSAHMALRESERYSEDVNHKKDKKRDAEKYKLQNTNSEMSQYSNDLLIHGKELFNQTSSRGALDFSNYFDEVDKKVEAKEMAARQAERDSNFWVKQYDKYSKNKNGKKNFFGQIGDMLNSPFTLVNSALKSIDNSLFRIIYGEDASNFLNDGELDENGKRGLFGQISSMLSGSMDRLADRFKEIIWSDESLLRRNYIKGRDFLQTKILDKTRSKLNDFFTPMGDAFSNGDTLTEMEEAGLTGDLKFNQKVGFEAYKLKKKAGLNFNKDFFTDMKTSFSDRRGGKLSSKENMNFAQRLGYDSANTVTNILGSISSFFLGDDIVDEDGNVKKTASKELWESVSAEFKDFLPKGIVYGAAGAAATVGTGLLTGMFLPGGPILGAIIGSTVGFIDHSEKFKTYLFGNDEKDGLIDKEVVAGFKKYAPKVAIGTGLGLTAANMGLLPAILSPVNPLIGGLIGSIGGMAAASDELRELLFGKKGDDDSGLMSKNSRKNALESALAGFGAFKISGAAMAVATSHFGILGALAFIPGGPILGPIAAGMAAAFNKDKIKNFFFGSDDPNQKDENGNPVHRNGVFDKMFNFGRDEIVKPFANFVNESGKNIKNWYQTAIIDQLKEGMQPFKDEMTKGKEKIRDAVGNIGGYMKEGINNAFADFLGKPLNEFLKEKVTDPLSKIFESLFKGIGSAVGAVISSPFRLINAIGTGKMMFADERTNARREKRDARRTKREFDSINRNAKWGVWADRVSDNFHKRNARIAKGLQPVWDFLYGASDMSISVLNNGVDIDDMAISGEIAGDASSTGTEKLSIWEKLKRRTQNNREKRQEERTRQAIETQNLRARDEAFKKEKNRDKANKREKRLKEQEEHKAKRKAQVIQDELAAADLAAAKRKRREEGRYGKADDDEARDSKHGRYDDFYRAPRFRKLMINLERNSEKIRDSVKGQLNGVGYNIAYIRNILLSKFGSDKNLAPSAKEEFGDYQKPGNILTRLWNKTKRGARNAKYAAADWFEEKFGFIGRGIGSIKSFFGDMLGGLVDAVITSKNFIKAVGGAFGEFFGTIKPAIIEGFKDLIGGIGDIFRGLTGLAGDGLAALGSATLAASEDIGLFAGSVMTSLGDALTLATGAISSFGRSLLEVTAVIGGDLVKGAWEGIKAIGEGAWIGAGMAADWMSGRNVNREIVNKKYLGEVRISGGNLGIDAFSLKDSYGVSRNLSLVSIFDGITIDKPHTALPVYIVNRNINTTDKGARQTAKDDIAGEVVGDILDDTSNVDPKVKEGVFKKFKSSFKRNMQQYEKSGRSKGTDKNISGVGSGAELESAKVSMAQQQVNVLGEIAEGMGIGAAGKAVASSGVARSIAGLSSLLAGLFPAIGTVVSMMGGNWDRVFINIAKKSPLLRTTLKNLFKDGSHFLVNNRVSQWVAEKTGMKRGLAYAKSKIDAKLGKEIIANMGRKELKSVTADLVDKYATKSMTAAARQSLVNKLADQAITSGGKDFTRAGLDSMVKKSVTDITAKSGKAGIIDAKMLGKKSTAAIVKESSEELAKNTSYITQIINKLKNVLSSSTFSKYLGNAKVLSGVTKALDSLGAYLAKTSAAKFSKTLFTKIIAKLGAPVFMLYDFVSGMAEANTIFKISGEPTWKMRICAGLAKLVSGVLFGLVFDTFLIELFYGCIASEDEMNKIKEMQDKLASEADAYNSENGTNYSVDEYNTQVANKRVFKQVWDGTKSAVKGALGIASDPVGASSEVLKSLVTAIEKLNAFLEGWVGSPEVDFNKQPIYGKGVTVSNESGGTTAKVVPFSKTEPSKKSNGMYLYTQDDNRWGSVKYGNSTIKEAGCAPTIAASLVSNYNQSKPVSPIEAAAFAQKGGFNTKDNGTNINFFAAFAKKYGIKVMRGIKHADAIMYQLKNNKPVIVMGRKRSSSSAFSGTTMHYMMLTAYDSARKAVAIMDPASAGIKYSSIENVLKDTTAVLFTDNSGKGMLAKFIPDTKTGTLANGIISASQNQNKPVGVVGKVFKGTKDFINKIANGAVSAYNKYGVLPSLTIAQAILETGSGKYSIGNNLFGIKAGSKWGGLTQWVNTSEFINGVKKRMPALFRDYNSIDESIVDHAKLLTGKRYSNVLSSSNYRDAAINVQKAGYATDPDYAKKLLNIIETYKLYQYDKKSSGYGEDIAGTSIVGDGNRIMPSALDGMYYYNQKDPKWKQNAFSTDLARSGCAPTAAAIVIASYGKPISPLEAEKIALKGGYKRENGATEIGFFPYIGKKYGVMFNIGIKSGANIIKNLLESKPVVVLGKGNKAKKVRGKDFVDPGCPFPEKPHYVVLSSYNKKSGMVQVIDPLNKYTGHYPLIKVLQYTTQTIYTADSKGKGINRSKNINDIYKIINAHTMELYKKKDYAALGELGFEGADNGSLYSVSSDGIGSDDESNLTVLNKGMDIFSMINKLFDGFSALGSIHRGSMTWDQAFQQLNGLTDEDLTAYKQMATPAQGKIGTMYTGSKFVTGDTDIQDILGKRIEALARDYKKPIHINSGGRTFEEQLDLWNKRDKKLDVKDSNGNITNAKVANPYTGFSYHRFGMAADLAGWVQKLPESVMNKYHLTKPVAGEPWHVSPTEIKNFSSSREMAKVYGYPNAQLASSTSSSSKNNVIDTKAIGDANSKELYNLGSKINNMAKASKAIKESEALTLNAMTLTKGLEKSSSSETNDTLLKLMVSSLSSIDKSLNKLIDIVANMADKTPVVTHATTSSPSNRNPSVRVTAGQAAIDSMTRR